MSKTWRQWIQGRCLPVWTRLHPYMIIVTFSADIVRAAKKSMWSKFASHDFFPPYDKQSFSTLLVFFAHKLLFFTFNLNIVPHENYRGAKITMWNKIAPHCIVLTMYYFSCSIWMLLHKSKINMWSKIAPHDKHFSPHYVYHQEYPVLAQNPFCCDLCCIDANLILQRFTFVWGKN